MSYQDFIDRFEIIGEVDRSDQSYCFDTLRVVRDGGKLYYATSSGCSCPSPFEEIQAMADLTPIKDFDEFGNFFNGWNSGQTHLSPTEAQDFLRKVRLALEPAHAD